MSTIPRTRRKRLNLGCAGIGMTAHEFDAIEFADLAFRYELIRGIVVASRYPSFAERDPNEELGYWLRRYGDAVAGSTLDLTLPECYVYCGEDRRRADRLIWAGLGRRPDPEGDLPAIAVEFVSKGKRDWLRDYEEKRAQDLELGIREYWVIDRFRYILTVFQRPPGEQAERVFNATAVYQTPILPGFELPLAKLFTLADSWKKPRTERK